MKKMKRAISLFLAVAMLLSACPISVFATTAGSTEDGTNLAISTYQDFQYTLLPDGTISICGYTGAPEDDTKGTYLEIPSSINNTAVTHIAEEAFADNVYIDTVTRHMPYAKHKVEISIVEAHDNDVVPFYLVSVIGSN